MVVHMWSTLTRALVGAEEKEGMLGMVYVDGKRT